MQPAHCGLSRPVGLRPTGTYVVRGYLDAVGDDVQFAVGRFAPAFDNLAEARPKPAPYSPSRLLGGDGAATLAGTQTARARFGQRVQPDIARRSKCVAMFPQVGRQNQPSFSM